jgi:two-component system cell cycle response regulator
VPAGFALVALVMVIYSGAAHAGVVSLALAAAALVGVIARFVVTYRNYLFVLGATEIEATTDALTGLGNRRALGADLEIATASGDASLLLLFDLNGFKRYNDSFGHPAGDALLERLGGCLRDAVGAAGTAYRMGGDEFCVLLGAGAGERTVSAAAAALSERGDGFAISASQGRAAIPAEATTPAEALRTADQRMYQDKRSARGPAGEQATHALLRVLTERHPDVGDHSHGVADLAEAVARHMGADDEQALEVRAGAELHDIGKAAIPDAILSKPGPLDDAEWAFMRRHTLIGERIVASAHALTNVARLVRSSHERWDGAGYPDGLAGDAIPLGARIVFVCDAFDAMLGDRPYSAALAFEPALAELERCAGSQFDPQVVAAFVAVSRLRAASPLDGAVVTAQPLG